MIGISGANRPEWVIADLACSFYGFTSVPIHWKAGTATYFHLTETMLIQIDDSNVEFIANQTEMSVVICDSVIAPAVRSLPRLYCIIPPTIYFIKSRCQFLCLKLPALKFVIFMDDYKPLPESPPSGPRVIRFSDTFERVRMLHCCGASDIVGI
jgi:hypothetical protein